MPDILAITERKLKEGEIYRNISFPKYRFVRVDSTTLVERVVFYVKETLKFIIMNDIKYHVIKWLQKFMDTY